MQGLRVDHIDGLFDPTGYLKKLRSLVGEESYLVVEKILEHDEQLPEEWPVQGSSGYAFLADVNQLFTSVPGRAVVAQLLRYLESRRHGLSGTGLPKQTLHFARTHAG